MGNGGEQSGRIDVVEAMYHEHGPAVLRFLQRRTGAQTAEDLLQETFAQALCHLNRLDRVQSVRAWLIAIARNQFINELRKKRALSFEYLQDFPAKAEQAENPRLEAMREAIRRLPKDQQEVILLKWHDGLSYQEISQVLNIPLGTVRSRLHHALSKLREIMEAKSSSGHL